MTHARTNKWKRNCFRTLADWCSIQCLLSLAMPFFVFLCGMLVYLVVIVRLRDPVNSLVTESLHYLHQSWHDQIEEFASSKMVVFQTISHITEGITHGRNRRFGESDCRNMGFLWMKFIQSHDDIFSMLFARNQSDPFVCALKRDTDGFYLYMSNFTTPEYKVNRLFPNYELGPDRREPIVFSPYHSNWFETIDTFPAGDIGFIPAFKLQNESLVDPSVLVYAYTGRVLSEGASVGVLQGAFRLDDMYQALLTSDSGARRFFLSPDGNLVWASHVSAKVDGIRVVLKWNDFRIDSITQQAIASLFRKYKTKNLGKVFESVGDTMRLITFKASDGHKYIVSALKIPNPFHDFNLPTIIIGSIVPQSMLLGLTHLVPHFSGIATLIFLIVSIVLAVTFAFCISCTLQKVAQQMFQLSLLHFPKKPSFFISNEWLSKVQPREVQHMLSTLSNMSRALQRLKLYLPVHMVRLMVTQSQLRPLMNRLFVTVAFSDIVGFSTFANQLTAEKLAQIMSEFYVITTECVQDQGGWVIELLGDALFVSYGQEQDTEVGSVSHTCAAVIACLQMNQRLTSHHAGWEAQGLPKIQMRHGIATGEAWCGCIGNSWRMQYSVLGRTVQQARFLEGFAKDVCVPTNSVLIDAQAMGNLPQHHGFLTRWIGPKTCLPPLTQVYQILGEERLFRTPKNLVALSACRKISTECDTLKRMWDAQQYEEMIEYGTPIFEAWSQSELSHLAFHKGLAFCLDQAQQMVGMRRQNESLRIRNLLRSDPTVDTSMH
eukprot:CAMPEP_0117452604 /NCGR_PEP_ID=MMETSP0759-20121206/9718_1 /TAXON_ID=63605 /ORGANISM="Percolomonas cosmopolitus, Strain WS" /LENGTH=772 /DNA_ID=CAMNT_0005245459 /DNA_START=807 /DNA_END=3125 /DNA_ORIENTATION=+